MGPSPQFTYYVRTSYHKFITLPIAAFQKRTDLLEALLSILIYTLILNKESTLAGVPTHPAGLSWKRTNPHTLCIHYLAPRRKKKKENAYGTVQPTFCPPIRVLADCPLHGTRIDLASYAFPPHYMI